MSNPLPCPKCDASCCGPVPIMAEEVPAIKAHLLALPPAKLVAIIDRKPKPADCAFLDNHFRCSIHPVRPRICREYGYLPGLACPKAPRVARHGGEREREFREWLDGHQGESVILTSDPQAVFRVLARIPMGGD